MATDFPVAINVYLLLLKIPYAAYLLTHALISIYFMRHHIWGQALL